MLKLIALGALGYVGYKYYRRSADQGGGLSGEYPVNAHSRARWRQALSMDKCRAPPFREAARALSSAT